MSDRDTIEAALAEYDDDIVRQLVDDVLSEVRNGRSVRSPFGLLVSRARRGVAVTTRRDEPSADPVPAPENPPASDDLPGHVVDDGVFDMLAQYEQNETGAELVRALDEVIASELTATSLRLLSPTALRALRAETFRRHGSPSSGTLARRDVAMARDASAERSRIHPT